MIKLSILLFLSTLVCCNSYSQDLRINNNNVRFREEPSLSGKIIKEFNLRDTIKFILKKEISKNDDFVWVKVNDNGKEGWVYGEYVDWLNGNSVIIPLCFRNINETHVIYNNFVFYVGMEMKKVLQFLNPETIDEDNERGVKTYNFKNGSLLIDMNIYTRRISQIIIYSDGFKLLNGVQVGTDYNKIIERNKGKNLQISGKYLNFSVDPLFYTSTFYANAILYSNDKKRITEIQISSPIED